MSCLGECWEVGPPPDSILFLPPPPPPAFLQAARTVHDNASASGGAAVAAATAGSAAPCAAQLCEWGAPAVPGGVSSGDYIELPHQDVESTWPGGAGLDDTWLLVLVASSIGVLLLGALLALLLLKCRDCVVAREHRQQTKHMERQIANATNNKITQHTTDIVAPTPPLAPDNRLVWAALTPRGTTRHYVSENYPHEQTEHHYETIDSLAANYPGHHLTATLKSSFDNSGFMDYDYEEPTPLMQLGDPSLFGQDMRCISTLRRMSQIPPLPRPRVSSPTRIEHPNLPPLNLHPHPHPIRRTPGNTLTRRPSEAGSILKYNIN